MLKKLETPALFLQFSSFSCREELNSNTDVVGSREEEAIELCLHNSVLAAARSQSLAAQ